MNLALIAIIATATVFAGIGFGMHSVGLKRIGTETDAEVDNRFSLEDAPSRARLLLEVIAIKRRAEFYEDLGFIFGWTGVLTLVAVAAIRFL